MHTKEGPRGPSCKKGSCVVLMHSFQQVSRGNTLLLAVKITKNIIKKSVFGPYPKLGAAVGKDVVFKESHCAIHTGTSS